MEWSAPKYTEHMNILEQKYELAIFTIKQVPFMVWNFTLPMSIIADSLQITRNNQMSKKNKIQILHDLK